MKKHNKKLDHINSTVMYYSVTLELWLPLEIPGMIETIFIWKK